MPQPYDWCNPHCCSLRYPADDPRSACWCEQKIERNRQAKATDTASYYDAKGFFDHHGGTAMTVSESNVPVILVGEEISRRVEILDEELDVVWVCFAPTLESAIELFTNTTSTEDYPEDVYAARWAKRDD